MTFPFPGLIYYHYDVIYKCHFFRVGRIQLSKIPSLIKLTWFHLMGVWQIKIRQRAIMIVMILLLKVFMRMRMRRMWPICSLSFWCDSQMLFSGGNKIMSKIPSLIELAWFNLMGVWQIRICQKVMMMGDNFAIESIYEDEDEKEEVAYMININL